MIVRTHPKLTKLLKDEVISEVETGPENLIIRTQNGLTIEVWHDLVIDGDEVIHDGGIRAEVKTAGNKVIATETRR